MGEDRYADNTLAVWMLLKARTEMGHVDAKSFGAASIILDSIPAIPYFSFIPLSCKNEMRIYSFLYISSLGYMDTYMLNI